MPAGSLGIGRALLLAHKGEWSNAGERHTRHVPEVIPGKKADLFRG